MISYILVSEHGQILRAGSRQSEEIAKQDILLQPTETLIFDQHATPGSNQYYANGQVVDMPPKPFDYHIFDYVNKVWHDPRTLGDLKAAKNAEINSGRLLANRGSFIFAGKTISCDELSRSDIDGINGIVALLGTMPPDWIGFWKTSDNSYVEIPDLAAWTGLYAAMVAQGQANFAHSQELKAAVVVAETQEAIDSIVW